jgi:hypothetical protein
MGKPALPRRVTRLEVIRRLSGLGRKPAASPRLCRIFRMHAMWLRAIERPEWRERRQMSTR